MPFYTRVEGHLAKSELTQNERNTGVWEEVMRNAWVKREKFRCVSKPSVSRSLPNCDAACSPGGRVERVAPMSKSHWSIPLPHRRWESIVREIQRATLQTLIFPWPTPMKCYFKSASGQSRIIKKEKLKCTQDIALSFSVFSLFFGLDIGI